MSSHYSPTVLNHFENPRNVGVMDRPDGVGTEYNPVCGDRAAVYLKVDRAQQLIEEMTFQSNGCVAAIAAASLMTELVKGMAIDSALRLTPKELTEALGGLPPAKVHGATLALEALHRAIADYLTSHSP